MKIINFIKNTSVQGLAIDNNNNIHVSTNDKFYVYI